MPLPGLAVLRAAGWYFRPRSAPSAAFLALLWGPRVDAEALRLLPGSCPWRNVCAKAQTRETAERE